MSNSAFRALAAECHTYYISTCCGITQYYCLYREDNTPVRKRSNPFILSTHHAHSSMRVDRHTISHECMTIGNCCHSRRGGLVGKLGIQNLFEPKRGSLAGTVLYVAAMHSDLNCGRSLAWSRTGLAGDCSATVGLPRF